MMRYSTPDRPYLRSLLLGLLLIINLILPTRSLAQTIKVECSRWDVSLFIDPKTSELKAVETEEIDVIEGTVKAGTRYWTNSVQVQAVLITANDQQIPDRLLLQKDSTRAGTYSVTQSPDKTTLKYMLKTPQNAGDTFNVKIYYTAASAETIDWFVVPSDHSFDVLSSTVRIRFPSGTTPEPGQVSVTAGDASTEVRGNTILVRSNGKIAIQEAFRIEISKGGTQ